jgi:ribosomal-protein-alanine N-acetyltransferase
VYLLESMTQGDVAEVSRVERRCFDNPWPTSAYRRELQNPAQNFYVVLRETPDYLVTEAMDEQPANAYPGGAASVRALPRRSLLPIGIGRRHHENGSERDPIIGFGGMWLAFDEAHITTIGVDPPRRGRGLGELLLLCMVD